VNHFWTINSSLQSSFLY